MDFRLIFRRFSLAPPATKAQNRNLKKESRDPHHMSWFLRCAVASYYPCILRNDFRTLRVQPLSIAYPQAHLVIKDMEIMQLIQLHSFHHGEKDAADSTAFFFFHSGGAAWGRSAQAPPE